MQAQTRVFVRTTFVLLMSALILAVVLPDIALPWHPFSTFGYSANSTGAITWVDKDASVRGLAVGDHIDRASLTSAQTFKFYDVSPLAPTGTRVRLPLTGGRTVTLVSHPYDRTLADNITDVVQMLVFLLIVVIAAALVLMRPAPATWAFFSYSAALAFVPAQLTFEYVPFDALFVITVIRIAVNAVGAAALVSFAMRFPQTPLAGAAKILERALLFGVAPAIAAIGITSVFFLGGHGLRGGPLVASYLWGTGIATALILIGRYLGASPEERSRLQWIVAAFALAFIPGRVLFGVETAGIFPAPWLINSAFIFVIVAPLSVAYTVFKHRLFDLRLIVSRALLYAASTSIVIGLLALVDWGVGRWLEASRFALAAELVLAVAIGVLLTTTHHRLERLLNNVIFRAQVAALQALRRFALETDLIADPHYLLLQTYEALRARLESEYAAIYTAEGSSYTLVTPAGDPVPQLLASHDLGVLRLRRWHEPFECEEPGHPLYGALLLPMTARGQLVGFIACGPKRDRTHYLPDEVETLSMLAHRTGSAYALLTLATVSPTLVPSKLPEPI